MLRSYPIQACQENWLHDALISIILEIHNKINQNQSVISSNSTWNRLVNNTLIPAPHKSELRSARGIRDRAFNYKDELLKLDVQQRQDVLTAIISQNSIPGLLDGTTQVNVIYQTLPTLHDKANDLFVFSYEKLTDFKIRERQYDIIFASLPIKICPFCGIERVMDPEETAQDQDHYLAKSIYPFAAANMRNLVPMCRCCNRDYKKNKDILYNENHIRRKAFDPYNFTPFEISLIDSTVIENTSPLKFNWVITFDNNSEESETWDDVFSIKERYKRDILDQYFDKWLSGYMKKCMNDRRRGIINKNFSFVQVREHLMYFLQDKTENPNIGMAGFLEPLAFTLLIKMYDEHDERVINIINDAVLGVSISDVA